MSARMDADIECTFDECMALEQKEKDAFKPMNWDKRSWNGLPHEGRAKRYRLLARAYVEAAAVADERAAWRDRCYRFGL